MSAVVKYRNQAGELVTDASWGLLPTDVAGARGCHYVAGADHWLIVGRRNRSAGLEVVATLAFGRDVADAEPVGER